MTLTSVIVYVVVMLVLVGIVGTITGFFYSSTGNLEESAGALGEFNKFNTYFLDEVKKVGNEIQNITQTSITFTSGTSFTFLDGGLYKDKVKIASNVKEFTLDTYKQEEKTVIKVYIKIGEDFAKTIEYVMAYNVIRTNRTV